MNYTTELAKEIINRFGLSETVEKVWKTRGTIPDKYSNPDYQVPVKLDNTGKVIQDRIVKILESGYLNNTLIFSLSRVTLQKFADVQRGKSNFSASEVIYLKKEINYVKIKIAKTIERKSNSALQSFFQSEITQIWPILKDAGLNRTFNDRISKFKITGIQLSDSDYEEVKNALVRCAIQLSL